MSAPPTLKLLRHPCTITNSQTCINVKTYSSYYNNFPFWYDKKSINKIKSKQKITTLSIYFIQEDIHFFPEQLSCLGLDLSELIFDQNCRAIFQDINFLRNILGIENKKKGYLIPKTTFEL